MIKEKDYNKDHHVYKVIFNYILGMLLVRSLQLRWGQKGMSKGQWKFFVHQTNVSYCPQKHDEKNLMTYHHKI